MTCLHGQCYLEKQSAQPLLYPAITHYRIAWHLASLTPPEGQKACRAIFLQLGALAQLAQQQVGFMSATKVRTSVPGALVAIG